MHNILLYVKFESLEMISMNFCRMKFFSLIDFLLLIFLVESRLNFLVYEEQQGALSLIDN